MFWVPRFEVYDRVLLLQLKPSRSGRTFQQVALETKAWRRGKILLCEIRLSCPWEYLFRVEVSTFACSYYELLCLLGWLRSDACFWIKGLFERRDDCAVHVFSDVSQLSEGRSITTTINSQRAISSVPNSSTLGIPRVIPTSSIPRAIPRARHSILLRNCGSIIPSLQRLIVLIKHRCLFYFWRINPGPVVLRRGWCSRCASRLWKNPDGLTDRSSSLLRRERVRPDSFNQSKTRIKLSFCLLGFDFSFGSLGGSLAWLEKLMVAWRMGPPVYDI